VDPQETTATDAEEPVFTDVREDDAPAEADAPLGEDGDAPEFADDASEFVDARPTGTHDGEAIAAAAAMDATADVSGEGGDDLLFYDAAADSGLDIQVIAPPRKTPGQEEPEPTKARRKSSGPIRRDSARLKKLAARRSSGRVRTLDAIPSEDAKDWDRRTRTAEVVDAALNGLLETAPRPQPDDPFAGKELAPFRLERLLGADRGERRYLGVEGESQELVLVRVFPSKGADPKRRALCDAAEAASRVPHPSLALSLGSGRTREAFFVGHEVPVGKTLAAVIAEGKPSEEAQVLLLIDQISAGLAALHARNVVHGDVSPESVRLEKEGVYVLTGAGLSRPRPDMAYVDVAGTPGFVAPDALDGGRHSPASDIYSLGCVAWSLIAGRPPFGSGSDGAALLTAQLEADEVRDLAQEPGASVSSGLALLIQKMTGRDPERRYADVEALRADLTSLRAGETLQPFPPKADPLAQASKGQAKRVNAGTLLLVLLGVLDLALLGGLGSAYLKAQKVELPQPLHGYELPLPGISEGGYGDTAIQPLGGEAPADDEGEGESGDGEAPSGDGEAGSGDGEAPSGDGEAPSGDGGG
jgi:serine/threonine protein kinase